jgi:tripeptide aminopeptidase
MIDQTRLLENFLDLVRIPSASGQEAQVAARITQILQDIGLDVQQDKAGNLFALVAGVGEPLMLNAHMDTVVPCERVNPVVKDGVIYSDGTSVLGGDDKAGVAVIIEVLRVLAERSMAHRPLEVLLTVREEVGLKGAKAFDLGRLRSREAVGLDAGGDPGTIIVSAPSQDSLSVEIHGRASHAGVRPEDGVDAIRTAAEAIVAMPLGRIDAETTANVGLISGGSATNIVADLVKLRGEARSRDRVKLAAQTRAMVAALEQAAQARGATANIKVTRVYEGYVLDEETPIVAKVSTAMRELGIEPTPIATGGGADANIFNAAGIATVQISAGMEQVHSCAERVALQSMITSAQLLLRCVCSD